MSADLLGIAAAGLASLGVGFFCIGAASMLRTRALDQRLREHVGVAGEDGPTPAVRREQRARPVGPVQATRLNRRLNGSSLGAMVQRLLTRAGLAWTAAQFIRAQALGAVVAAAFGF